MMKDVAAKDNNLIGKASGFALMELFIALSIIAILAAIAIPGYLGMQERSKNASVVRTATDLFNDEFKKSAKGYILYNPPDVMTVGKKDRIEVRISRKLTNEFEKGLEGRGRPVIEKDIRVGTSMKSFLTGDDDNFLIKPLSHEEQLVTGEGFSQWEWDVTPRKSGLHTLSFRVTVTLLIPGIGEKEIDYPVFDRKIEVHANPLYTAEKFGSDNWKYFIDAIIAIFAISSSGLIAWFLKRRKARQDDSKGTLPF